jgi:prevent-host-death family protein
MADVVAKQVSVRDLKTHLSSWLARAEAGEMVEVTSHRKPIARITAVKSPEKVSPDPLQAADVTPFAGPGLMRVGGCGHATAPC